MIVIEVDQGWGPEWPIKKLEQQILDQYLQPLQASQDRVAVINSVWYNSENHQAVLKQLRSANIDRVVLVAMIDAALIQDTMFGTLGVPISRVGYFKSDDEIDFWSTVVDRFFRIDFDVTESQQIDTAYLCYNRKPHAHRLQLFDQLQQQDLLDRGVVTLGQEDGRALRCLPQDVPGNELAPNLGYGIVNDIMSLGNPYTWNRCLLNIVTESVFDVDRDWFVSEKIYKPILGMRPFLVYAPNGAQAWLEHIGIESYVRDFEDICSIDVSRPENIATMLKELCCLSAGDLQSKYLALLPKIRYNRWKLDCYLKSVNDKIKGKIRCQT